MFSQKSWMVVARMWDFPAARLMLPDFGKPGADENTHRKHRTSVAFAWWSIICAMCVKLSAATHFSLKGLCEVVGKSEKGAEFIKLTKKNIKSRKQSQFSLQDLNFQRNVFVSPLSTLPGRKMSSFLLRLNLTCSVKSFRGRRGEPGHTAKCPSEDFQTFRVERKRKLTHKAAHKDHRDKRAKPSFQFASVLRLVSQKINGRENVGTRRARRKHRETKSNLLAGVSIVVQTNFPAKIFNSHLRQSPRNLCLPARCLLSCFFSLSAPRLRIIKTKQMRKQDNCMEVIEAATDRRAKV